MSRAAFADHIRRFKPIPASAVPAFNAFADAMGIPPAPSPPIKVLSTRSGSEFLTARVALELISHEAIVQEAYKDSKGIWTWGVGVTNASGHTVYPRYKDNPQTIARCIEVYLWLLRERYIPDVAAAFEGFALSEAQFAAALSFHYNTGGIKKASWVTQWKDNNPGAAHRSFLLWNKPPEIIGRRKKERDLFFDGKWSSDGTAIVYPVKKPSYTPDWRNAQRIDVRSTIEEMLA